MAGSKFGGTQEEWNALVDRNNLMNDITSNLLKDIHDRKEAIIKMKFKEKGFGYLLMDIEKKRFKRIIIEKHPDCEKYYADNGTDEGLLIVTFKNMDSTLSNDLNSYKIESSIQYY